MHRFTSTPSRTQMSRRLFLTTTGALSLGAALTACGGGDSGGPAASAEPVSRAEAFTGQQVNYAATVSFLLGLVIVIASYGVLLTANRRRTP